MPRRTIRRKTRRRRRRPNRAPRNRGSTMLPKSLVPFPKTRMVKLRYMRSIQLDAGLDAPTSWGFRSNSIYDPDYSSGTTPPPQPYYTDQLFALYKKATVVGSKITITPFGATSTGHYSIVGIYRDDDTTARTSDLQQILEKPGTVWKGVGDANQNPKSMSLTYSAKKTHGGKPMSNVNLYCTAAADPVDEDFFRVFAGSPNPSTDPGSLTVLVKIEYTVVFHDRIEPATSL